MAITTPHRPDATRALSRRRLIQSLGLLSTAPWLARAETSSGAAPLPLPLHPRELVNHIGTSVPDVTRSATFYSRLFQGGALLGQEKPALRYEINFRPGALSIGPLRSDGAGGGAASGGTGSQGTGTDRRPYIDHFCIMARPYDAAAWRARLDEEKLRHFAGGSFVVIGGISVQLLGARAERAAGRSPPAAAAGGFKPMAPLFNGPSIVTPRGFDHLTLHIADLDASAATFKKLFGVTPQAPSRGLRVFQVGDIRLELREAQSAERPSIKVFAIRVAPYDPGRVRAALEELGAKVEPPEQSRNRTILRFADPDGIDCELRA